MNINAQSQPDVKKQLVFEYITIDQGLLNNGVNAIAQDNLGFMWFATNSGLNKYNGIETASFLDEDLDMQSNVFQDVYCDSKGRLWASTTKGIGVFNQGIGRFEKVAGLKKLDSANIYDIEEDNKGYIWLATSEGLFCYGGQPAKLQKLEESYSINESPCDTVDLIMCSGNQIWFSYFHKGIGVLDISNGSFKFFQLGPDGDNQEVQAECFFKDKLSYLWIGTYNHGIYRYSPFDDSFEHILVDTENQYASRVRTFFENPDGNLFVGTRAGLYLLDRAQNQFQHYSSVDHKFSTLSNNSVVCSFMDNNAGLWIGTRFGGVNYANLERKPFVHFRAGDNDPHFLNHSSVFAFAQDSKGRIYVGTENGVNILDVNNYNFEYLTSSGSKGYTLSYNDVKALAVDKFDNLWIGTNNGGLNYYNTKTKKVTYFKNDPENPHSLWSDKVYNLLNDNAGNLWVVSNTDRENNASALSLLKPGSRNFIHFNLDFYGGLWEKDDGNILIGGKGGFYNYEKKSGTFSFIENHNTIGNVNCIFQDKNGVVWIGSNKGLVSYNAKEHEFKVYSRNTGYPIDIVDGILDDEESNIWLSTNSGLIKLIDVINIPENVNYKLYTKSDGLQSKQFNPNAFLKTKEGELLFGGINGFNAFYPEKINDSKYSARLVFSELYFDRKKVVPGKEFYGKSILDSAISQTKEIIIPPKVQSFRFVFNAIHYVNPVKNSYKFKLEGIDDEWTFSNAYNNKVTYTRLPSGTYTFKVVAINSDGKSNPEKSEMIIKVLPHIWETVWFKILIVALLIILGWMVYKMRMNQLRWQKVFLGKKVKEKTKELEASYINLKERQEEVLFQNEQISAQNEEICQQNEEISAQRDELQRKSDEIVQAFENSKLLNDFGKKITNMFNFEQINDMIYKYLSSLMDTSIFGIGIYNEQPGVIDFTNMVENGKLIPPFSSDLEDPTSMAAYCLKNQSPVICGDFENEYKNYISDIYIRSAMHPKSLIYVPLTVNKKRIGVFTVQSYNYNAYSQKDLYIFESLASFIAIAIDNSWAYKQLEIQNKEIEEHRENLSKMVYDRTKELEKAKVKAEESDRLKSSFLANMSHEIRTPLNAIIGFVEVLMSQDMPEEEENQLFTLIQSSGFYLSNLISDIIDISKIEADQLDINIEKIELDTLFDKVNVQLAEELNRHNISTGQNVSLELQMDGFEGMCVSADNARIRQVLKNLVGNAIKFTKQGNIQYGVKEANNSQIIFYIKDTGIGIDNNKFDIIFDRFRKIEDNIDFLYRGTGLGLAICKFLVDKMNGKIWLESEKGKGTCFYFTLPLHEEKTDHKIHIINPEEVSEFPDWSHKHILIVEDERSNYLLLEALLKDTGVNIFWAKDGAEAIRVYENRIDILDLVLMDVKLPEMDGMDAAQLMKAQNKEIPIIAQTAYGLHSEEFEIRNSGFDDYISKPIAKKLLFRLISNFFSN